MGRSEGHRITELASGECLYHREVWLKFDTLEAVKFVDACRFFQMWDESSVFRELVGHVR